MFQKRLQKEAARWSELGIITPEQAGRILALYRTGDSGYGILPILGSILLGLGLLSFVAANWQLIPQLLRLALIMGVMGGCYVSAEWLVRRGSEKLGTALAGVGVMAFGGGIILIGQMFHLTAYGAGSFILWAAAAAGAAFLYSSRYLYLLSLLLFTVAQWYSVSEFHSFSYTAAILMAVILGWYVWRRPHSFLIGCLSVSFTLQALMWAVSEEIAFLWMFVPAMAVYVVGDALPERRGGYALQAPPLAAAYLFAVFLVLFPEEWKGSMLDELRAQPLFYLLLMGLLLACSLFMKLKQQRGASAWEWVLLVPFIYLPAGVEVLYLLALFFFSLYVLWRGYAEEFSLKIHFGTALFLGATLVAYVKLTWAFMDRSLFFVLGGVLLIGVGWFLSRRNREILGHAKGDDKHDQ